MGTELDQQWLELVGNHWESLAYAAIPSTGGHPSFAEIYTDEPQRIPSFLGDMFAHALNMRVNYIGAANNEDLIAAAQAVARALFCLDFPGYPGGTVHEVAHIVGESF